MQESQHIDRKEGNTYVIQYDKETLLKTEAAKCKLGIFKTSKSRNKQRKTWYLWNEICEKGYS